MKNFENYCCTKKKKKKGQKESNKTVLGERGRVWGEERVRISKN